MSQKHIFAVCLALVLAMSLPSWTLAQCGGGSGNMSSMHDQHMGSSGHMMGSGQMGMSGSQAPVQTDPSAVAPGYVTPAPPASGYGMGQDNSGSGQMMRQGDTGSGHSGHRQH